MTKETYLELREKTLAYFSRAHIALTSAEEDAVEVADFGLDDVMRTGLESIVYINTDRCCAKEMVLLPYQTCPEHLHPPVGEDYPGKEETFRCRMGTVYLYVEGAATEYTLYPGTKHWFQAGSEGAVVSEFSTHCYDEYDIFTDTRINRIPTIE